MNDYSNVIQIKLVCNCACHLEGSTPSDGDTTPKTLFWAKRNLQTQCDCLLQKYRSNSPTSNVFFCVPLKGQKWACPHHIPSLGIEYVFFGTMAKINLKNKKQSRTYNLRKYANRPGKSSKDVSSRILPETNISIVLELCHAKRTLSSSNFQPLICANCWL